MNLVMAKMRKKPDEKKKFCSNVRTQQKMVGGTGRIGIWEELAEAGLEDSPGLLEVRNCNFC